LISTILKEFGKEPEFSVIVLEGDIQKIKAKIREVARS